MSRKRTRGDAEVAVKNEEPEATAPTPSRNLRNRGAKAEAQEEGDEGQPFADTSDQNASQDIEVTQNNYLLLQDLQSDEAEGKSQKKKKKYTGQTQEERLKLREQYRTLQEQLKDNKDLLEDPAVFRRLIRNQNVLLRKVKSTGEALYDAKVLGEVAEIGLKFTETAARANYGTVSDYVRKLSERAARLENPGMLWGELGQVSGRYFRGAPATNFMLGTFEIEQKAPRARQPREAKESAGMEKMPEQVKSTADDEKTATDARVQDLHARLAELDRPMNLFNFLLNPDSYTQSIENLFDFSFLLKHQRAEVMMRDGVPYVNPHDEPTEADWSSGVTPRSIVVKMDFAMYQEALRLYNVRKSHLPTRRVQA